MSRRCWHLPARHPPGAPLPAPHPNSWGGHGRTGTLIAVMLARLYGLTCGAALRFTQVAGVGVGVEHGAKLQRRTMWLLSPNLLLLVPPAIAPSPQAFHDSRKFPQGVRSPQTTPQVAQARAAVWGAWGLGPGACCGWHC